MASDKKLNLEWIPEAYAVKEVASLKKDVSKPTTGSHLIVKSTGLYKNKKSRCY